MKTSQRGIDLIKESEGCKLRAYYCPAGVLTIGYGHTGRGVQSGMTISQEQADDFLRHDLATCESFINAACLSLMQGEYDALVSFAFNLGIASLERSTLWRKVKAGDMAGAAAEFPLWVHGDGKVLPGLVTRRNAEAALFKGD